MQVASGAQSDGAGASSSVAPAQPQVCNPTFCGHASMWTHVHAHDCKVIASVCAHGLDAHHHDAHGLDVRGHEVLASACAASACTRACTRRLYGLILRLARCNSCADGLAQTTAHACHLPATHHANTAARPQVFQPGLHDLGDGEELDYDRTAYDCLLRWRLEWPCLSFDITKDSLGERRESFPHTAFMVAGTQAPEGERNYVSVMRLAHVTQGEHGKRVRRPPGRLHHSVWLGVAWARGRAPQQHACTLQSVFSSRF